MISTSTKQAMLNHHHQLGLFEDQDQDQIMSTPMGFYSLPPNNNLALPPLLASPSPPSSSLKTFTILPSTSNLHETLLLSSSDHLGGPHLLSLQRSSANLWAWDQEVNNGCLGNGIDKRSGGDECNYVGDENKNKKVIGVSTMKMKMKMKKKIKASNVRRKVREPRFCFKTMTEVDVLNDGYKWRKYGQKVVKNNHRPRSYYRCTQDSCRVKKRVERLAEDPRMVITTYEGRHAHSPSHDLDSPPHHDLTNFFC